MSDPRRPRHSPHYEVITKRCPTCNGKYEVFKALEHLSSMKHCMSCFVEIRILEEWLNSPVEAQQ